MSRSENVYVLLMATLKRQREKNKSRSLFSICPNNIQEFLEKNLAKVSTMYFPHHLLRGSLLD
jgi:hypothetical protein